MMAIRDHRWLLKIVLAAILVGQAGAAEYIWLSTKRRAGMITHTQWRIHDFKEVLVHYGVDHADQCPRSMSVLVAHGYLGRPLTDYWGTALAFTCTSPYSTDDSLVVSAGPDRKFGTRDDIRSDRN